MIKKEINIGTIDNNDKVTLSKVITKILSTYNSDLDNPYDIDKNLDRITISSNDIRRCSIYEQSRTINDKDTDLSLITVDPKLLSKAREDILLSRQKGATSILILIDDNSNNNDRDEIESTLRILLNDYGYIEEDTPIIFAELEELTLENDKDFISAISEGISKISRNNISLDMNCHFVEPISDNNHYLKNSIDMNRNSKIMNGRIKTKYSDNKYLFRNHNKR